MDNVIDKTKDLIAVIDSSDLIKDLDYYKKKVMLNSEIMALINRYNKSNDDYEKMSLKEKIYKHEEYRCYMKYYNELFYYVLKINNGYRKFTDSRSCNNESH